MRVRLPVALAMAATALLGACGSSSDSADTTTAAGGDASITAGATESSGAEATEAANSSLDTKTIAISFPNGSKQDAVLKEFDVAKETAAAEGYELIIDDPGNDQQKQVNTIDTWIQQGVGTIIAQPVSPETIESTAEKARAAGIKWITYANEIENQDATLGFDHIAGGNAIGAAACEWAETSNGGAAKVAILTFEKGAWAQKRREGIEQGLASCGATMDVVARQDALSQTEGLTAMSTILQANPDVNVVLAVEETATEGAFQAFVNGGKAEDDPTLFLAGIDGTLRALELIEQGSMYRASAALSLTEVGKGMVLLPKQLQEGTEGDYLVPLELVTPETPDLLAKYIEDLG
ncbi:MAG: sugar ABC transporter substrate-binding protein [Acidimicrobiales bacterium]